MRFKIYLTLAGLIAATTLAVAQTHTTKHSATNHSATKHNTGMDHTSHTQTDTMNAGGLKEAGQGAFAALSEVVRHLEADPATNWSQVDLGRLRAHLVDMDRLITDAEVTQTELPNGIVAIATGDPKTLASLQRMVPAHASQLALDERWAVAVSALATGMELRVTSDNASVIARIKGLGFFGLMASQDHHREHHLMMALGHMAHGE